MLYSVGVASGANRESYWPMLPLTPASGDGNNINYASTTCTTKCDRGR